MSESPPPQSAAPTRLLGRFWTVPNMLSLTRLALVIPITYLTWVGGPLHWLFALLGVGAFTDWLDGRVARWLKTVSGWGKVLDPLADKFAAALIVSALALRPVAPNLPLWLLVLVVARDACILAGGILMAQRTGQVAISVRLGKLAVAALALTCLATVLEADPPVLWVCVWLTAALLICSFIIYLLRFLRFARTGELPEEAVDEEASAHLRNPVDVKRSEKPPKDAVVQSP